MRRIKKDVEELQKNNFEILCDGEEEINFESFCVLLNGPQDTPYENGQWRVRFTISNMYPFSSPSVGFVDKILHPNIDWASGSVCLDALNKKWSPVFSLRHIMEALLPYLLTNPNPEDPLNREAAVQLFENKKAYTLKVLDATKRYCYKKN